MKKALFILLLLSGIANAQYKTNLVDLWHYEDIGVYDGNAIFDLSVQNHLINNLDFFDCTVEYYLDLNDAYNGVNQISNYNFFSGFNNQDIYVKIIDNNSSAIYYDQFTLRVLVDDTINIPDSNFKSILLSTSACSDIYNNYISIDSNFDGEIQLSEANNVYNLYLDTPSASDNISNISGIENFKNLTNLNASDNQFAVFDEYSLLDLQNLRKLHLRNCDINAIYLNSLINLRVLELQQNNLTSIDVSNLNYIYDFASGNNPLLNLNINHLTDLISLKCYSNNLTTLNLSYFPKLSLVQCEGNQLTSLDLTNNSNLSFLDCTFNNLQILDCMANSNLTAIYFIGNPLLHTVLIKNGSNESLNMDYGSWTENWMPFNNPSIQYVCVDDTQYADVRALVDSGVEVNTYCSFTPGGDYNTITGLVQYDFNQNGCDVLDFPANYTRIDVNLDGVSTNSSVFSNGVGVYNLYTSTTGVYNLVPNIENPSFFNVSPISADVPVMTIDNSVATQNFCITANGVHPDLEIVIAPIIPARPGFTAEYQIVYRNKGNQVMSQLYGVNFFYNQNLMSFVSATQVPSSIVSGGMSWDFANLLPFESRSINVVMQINAPTDTNPVNIGDVLQFTSSIMPMAGDEYTVDNLFQLNQTVVGSYDPNDITCIQGNIVAPSYIGEYLHYVINFENTGTAPAENVVVKIEVNPNDFDINSLRILESSHNATIKINNNILEIIFQTIMLDTGGHGNVLLKVKSKENLVLNDIVTKNAKIYFDYNFPIVTNDANTIFQALSNAIPIKDLSISLYPNPTSSLLNIKAENRIKSVELYDVQGRIIQVNKADSNEVLIDVSVCNSGVYFVKVTTDFGSQIKKVVKE